MMFVEQLDGARDVASGAFALHARGREEHVNGARAPRDDIENVANGRAGWRRNYAHASGKNRQRPFQLRCKQAFRLQAIAQLLKRDLQRARAHRIERLHDQFILAARFVNRQPPARPDVQAVSWSKTYAAVRGTKTFRAQLRAFVLDREVPVTG